MKTSFALLFLLLTFNSFAMKLTCREKLKDGTKMSYDLNFSAADVLKSVYVSFNDQTWDYYNPEVKTNYSYDLGMNYISSILLDFPGNDTFLLMISPSRYRPEYNGYFTTEKIDSYYDGLRDIKCNMK